MRFLERMRLRARTRDIEAWWQERRYCSIQHDYDIADGPGATVRGDINDALDAAVTWNSGAADPSTTFPRMRSVQTTAGVVKRRNAANSAWIVESTDDETLVVSRSSNTILDVSDIGKTFVATVGFTQTLDAVATLTGSWWCRYRIESGVTVVFDPNSSENIDAATTKTVVGPRSGFIVCNGSELLTIGFDASTATSANLLINGAFRINQRLPATNADDTYAHDRWNVLTQTGTIAVTTLADVENGMAAMARLTQSQAAAQRMGYTQIIEGKNCKHLRGQAVTFRFGRVRISASQPIRYAILEWTGTEDAVTSDVVNDWTSTDYTDGAAKFFVDTSITPSGNTSHTPGAATLTDGPSLTVTLGSTFNNLIVLAWTEGTAAQNVTLDLGKAQLESGSVATEFANRLIQDEEALCLRYLWVVRLAGSQRIATGQAYATNAARFTMPFPKRMRAAPTLTVSAAGNFDLTLSDASRAACTAVTLDAANQDGASVNATISSGLAGASATHLADDGGVGAVMYFIAEL